MPISDTTGLTEPDIIVNGHALTFAECMTVRVALSTFRIELSDRKMRAGIGEPLATNYDTHAARVEYLMRLNQPSPSTAAVFAPLPPSRTIPDCTCRNPRCGHPASQHVGPDGACVEANCACGPGGWT